MDELARQKLAVEDRLEEEIGMLVRVKVPRSSLMYVGVRAILSHETKHDNCLVLSGALRRTVECVTASQIQLEGILRKLAKAESATLLAREHMRCGRLSLLCSPLTLFAMPCRRLPSRTATSSRAADPAYKKPGKPRLSCFYIFCHSCRHANCCD